MSWTVQHKESGGAEKGENLKGALSPASCYSEFPHWHRHRLVGDHLVIQPVLEDVGLVVNFGCICFGVRSIDHLDAQK